MNFIIIFMHEQAYGYIVILRIYVKKLILHMCSTFQYMYVRYTACQLSQQNLSKNYVQCVLYEYIN